MGSCFKKKKPNTTKTVKKKSSGSVTAKSSGYFPELTTSAGPESDKRTGQEKFDANPARQQQVANKAKRKKKAKQKALREATTTTTTTDTSTDTSGDSTVEVDDNSTVAVKDTTTSSGGTIGDTSVTTESIYTRDPEEAISDQERLAAEELKRQRIKRARTKQSLLRKRLERTQEVGSGRRVLSGTERDLNVQTKQSGSGKRGGAGRRSLITGSTGGIGYYSRFL